MPHHCRGGGAAQRSRRVSRGEAVRGEAARIWRPRGEAESSCGAVGVAQLEHEPLWEEPRARHEEERIVRKCASGNGPGVGVCSEATSEGAGSLGSLALVTTDEEETEEQGVGCGGASSEFPFLSAAEMLPPWNSRRYRLLRVLVPAPRSGGQIELHEDCLTGEMVAVKRVPHDRICDSPQAYHERFPEEVEDPWKEMEVTQALGLLGPRQVLGVCHCHGAFLSPEGDALLACEYLPGGDLFDYASQSFEPGPSREAEAWPIVLSLLATVRELHEQGVAHGDISLENLLRRKGRPCEVVLVDFGMAVTGDLASATGVRGKASYQAPEMHTDSCYDARAADYFACGVVVYALAVRGYPWNSTRPGVCRAFAFAWKHGLEAFFRRRRATTTAGERPAVAQLLSLRYQRLLSILLDFDPERRLANALLLEELLCGWPSQDALCGG
mmetsp:Transcript_35287/g.101662  ORF Transcript_35287/g.101662 Transcript_35287/m.101662 type:complete len:442 (+) Transcript_35287:171-1496(+)